jgi:hypothetical protein
VVPIPRFDWPEPPAAPPPLHVAHTQELAWLDSHLDEALNGNGRVVFVTGDAGRDKTSLLAEFACCANSLKDGSATWAK